MTPADARAQHALTNAGLDAYGERSRRQIKLVKFSASALVALLFLVGLGAIAWPLDASAGQLNLTWIDAFGDALGFSVERSRELDSSFAVVATTGPGVTTFADGTVADATTYCYRVRAFNSTAYSEYSYPACGTTSPAGLTLALSINRDTFELGDYFQLDVSFAQGGSSALVDVYVGSVLPSPPDPAARCPDGDLVAYVLDARAGLEGLVTTCPSEELAGGVRLYSNIPAGILPTLMSTDLFSFDWPLTIPGDYTIFMTVTQAGTTNVIAQGTVTVSYSP